MIFYNFSLNDPQVEKHCYTLHMRMQKSNILCDCIIYRYISYEPSPPGNKTTTTKKRVENYIFMWKKFLEVIVY